MRKEAPFSVDYLRTIIDYNADQGTFIWLQGHFAGKTAGSVASTGHLALTIKRKHFNASRIAWYHHHGTWPTTKVYYKDGNILNLRIANLQLGKPYRPEAPFSLEYLRANFHYDASTGLFTRHGRKVGKRAWDGRSFILVIKRKKYAANRVAWFYETGEWPSFQVNHQNRDLCDLRFSNLAGPNGANIARLTTDLRYEPEEGAFYLRDGKRADRVDASGLVILTVDVQYQADQVAWYLETGEWLDEVFHRNHDRWDNTFANLSSIPSSSAPGRSIPGVEWKSARHKWQARLVDHNGHILTQRFAEFDEAVEARQSAERRFVEVAEPKLKKKEKALKSVAKKRKLNPPHAGVSMIKPSGKWRASYIRLDGMLVSLGNFVNLEDAIAARKAAELLPDFRPPMRTRSPTAKNIDLEGDSSPEVLIQPLEPQP